ncbi:carboxypeptidase regulatory-like domain-containing protein [Sphingomonas albertensis]|uniref:Carboxypeptidase regulatory-like domain-containing protein n=1 Tax=Sphingomonas albertensis TaxID=2762591 RepID=A0ABR7AI63_9SPHN|nr:carboxypeptidase regulatory-like domain-containing protein [Sphingomonas albertensis]MBC3940138.1 carboxypeptidase regulatory-like domain-containing protein [Sphingomonas albertensis]
MTIAQGVATILALAVVLAWVRLLLWQRRAPVSSRAERWRLVALLALQPVAGMLLYCTVFPPAGAGKTTGALVIATAGAPRFVATDPDERLIALPEASARAGGVVGAEQFPDLGTALRRYPAVGALRIVGSGLEPRDRQETGGRAVSFEPTRKPRGLIALQPPGPIAAGARFAVTARAGGLAGGSAELLDPASRVIDTQPIGPTGTIALSGTARAAGTALFTVILRDGSRALVEQASVPVWVPAPASPPTRVLILAGAPGPEVKYLRRWATDAGLAPQVRVGVGGGVSLADTPPVLTTATLAKVDAAILDDRTWDGIGAAGRQAVAAAVRGGMGLVVRITGPVAPDWQVLGLTAAGTADVAPVTLRADAPSDEALAARRGPGTRDAPAAVAGARDTVPVLTRQAVTIAGGIPILRDIRGTVVAASRSRGRGKVALISLQDSFALVTSGHGDAHAELWSQLVSEVARRQTSPLAQIDSPAFAGQRTRICGAGSTTVIDSNGGAHRVLMDPATGAAGCAGYWPVVSGWAHLPGPPAQSFYVYPAAALPNIRALDRSEGTQILVGNGNGERTGKIDDSRGPSGPWFIGWVMVCCLLWWLERLRRGRTATDVFAKKSSV